MAPTLTLGRRSFVLSMRHQVSQRKDPTLLVRPTTKHQYATTGTLLQHLASSMAARGVFLARLMGPRETSPSAPGFNFTMHGHLKTTIVEEILRLVTGLRPC